MLQEYAIPPVEVNLDQAVYALSGALDLVGVDDVQHGKRVTYVAIEVSCAFDLKPKDREDLYHAALLHDFGVSSTRVHHHLVSELEWDNIDEHCSVGAWLVAAFPPLAHLKDVIRYHHTHWDALAAEDLEPRDALLANLVFLADRVDAVRTFRLKAGDADPVPSVQQVMRDHRGSFFNPKAVDAFLERSRAAGFWERLEPAALDEYFHENWPPRPEHVIGLKDARTLARLFAHVVDAKSPFTARHSAGVARLACHLGTKLGLSRERLVMLDIAALLHDLGKLRVPDEILDKPAGLDQEEWQVMRRHALDSRRLLLQVDGFRTVSQWAGLHHETPRGDGYPLGYADADLPLEARIISVADVFQALAQDRPYRTGLGPEDILSRLRAEAGKGHLDPGIVDLVSSDLNGCYAAAMVLDEGILEVQPCEG